VDRLAAWLATVFGIGYLPLAPATWASATTALAVLLFLPVAPRLEIALVAVLTPLAVWTAGRAERRLGQDAHPIVIDEVVGQLVALWAVPREPGWIVVGFFLFRFFDVVKPLGVAALQRLPGGLGVVADDLLAGLYARLTLAVAALAGPVAGGWLRP
jgi:phosphatidylglycerophosphatase A